MAKNKGTWKPPQKEQQAQEKRPLLLSQCMIVKNEEENMERALSWAKGIAFEQIVVDTGSTDRTVEIAKKMGAKVYHFEWINDFAAAKNFAIDQAKGDWIAFLDADEYMLQEHARKLYATLTEIDEQNEKSGERVYLLRAALLNLDERGNIFSSTEQDRFFINTPLLRYDGAIHEQFKMANGEKVQGANLSSQIAIYHTGYAQGAIEKHNKKERNLNMLRAELEKDPANLSAKAYYGVELVRNQKFQEAKAVLRELIEYKAELIPQAKNNVYSSYIRALLDSGEEDRAKEVCEEAMHEFPENPDYAHAMGKYYNTQAEFKKAWELLLASERALQSKEYVIESTIRAHPEQLFYELAICAYHLNDMIGIVRYATLTLKQDRQKEDILLILMQSFLRAGVSARNLFELLQNIYQFNTLKDKLFVLKHVKITGNQELYHLTYNTFSDKEKEWFEKRPEEEKADPRFMALMDRIKKASEGQLLEEMKRRFLSLPPRTQTIIADYFKKYPFWGSLRHAEKNYEVFEQRAKMLKQHTADFLWLYNKLNDARSKNVLFAILSNWLDMDFNTLRAVKDRKYKDYFDKELVACDENEVFVDIGAFVGDTVANYIASYGAVYRRIYCYEITPSVFEKLQFNLKNLPNIVFRHKGAGAKRGELFLNDSEADSSANTLKEAGQTAIEMVSIDEDIEEPATFIKMDIEGAEQDALMGCERQIRENSPKLAICTYHGNEDIIKIPMMIEKMNKNYTYYMRHYGGDLIPTEFMLYALPNTKEEVPVSNGK